MDLFTDSAGSPFGKPVRRGVLLLASALFAALLYWMCRMLLLCTADVGGIEENVVYGMAKLLRGLPLYEHPEQPTFDVMQYTPLYYYITAGIGHLLGVDPSRPMQLFMLSRALSLAFNLGTVAVLFVTARRLGAALWSTIFWSTLILGTLTGHFYSRPDSLYLLLFATSFMLFLRGLAQAGPAARRSLALASVVASLSVLAKQTGILPVGLIGLYFLWQRDWRALFRHVTITALVLGTSFGVLCLHYGAEVLWMNVVVGIRNGFSLDLFQHVFLRFRYLSTILFHIGGGILAWRMLRDPDPVRKAIGLAIPVTFFFALITGLKSGSRLNYFMENFLVIFLALSLVFSEKGYTLRRIFQGGLLLYAFVHSTMGVLRLRALVVNTEAKHGEVQYANALAVRSYLENDRHLADGSYVFLQDRGFLEILLVGRGVLDQKDIIFFSPPDLYDYSLFFAAMDDGRVRFAVSKRNADITILGRDFPQFVPTDTVGGHIIFENRNARATGSIP